MIKVNKAEKLRILADSEGYEDVYAMLEAASTDSVTPGICVRDGCTYTTEVEPDQRSGYCEECRLQTVRSCLVLAEII